MCMNLEGKQIKQMPTHESKSIRITVLAHHQKTAPYVHMNGAPGLQEGNGILWAELLGGSAREMFFLRPGFCVSFIAVTVVGRR